MPGERILIVEDEKITSQNIQNSLQNLGYSATATASSGAEALAKALEFKPDLILIDSMLKGPLNGFEVAAKIRGRRGVPIVFLTAHADDQTLKQVKNSEAFGYLLKPFDERELRATIEMALYQHMMDRKLKESREWFETTLRCLGDAVVATDVNDCIQLINPIAETLTGWPRAEAIGRKLSEVFCLKDQPTTLTVDTFKTQNNSGQPATILGKDSILIARDGHPAPIDHSAAAIVNGDGNIQGVVVVFRNVKDRCLVEERERAIQERLSRAKRMESLGILASGVAHDLNNILGPIINYPDQITKELAEDSPLRADLDIIKNSTHKALDIVGDLLALDRLGHVPKETLALNAIVEACLQSHKFQALQAQVPLVLLKTDLARDDELAVMGSRQHLQAVVMNLIINAFATMPDGGHVLLRTEREHLNQAQDGYELIAPGHYVVLRVSDTGSGIHDDDINQIFEPFYTKRKLGLEIGSGLGLAVVYGVIKAHKGFLNVINNEEGGTDFIVYLPAAGLAGDSAYQHEPLDYRQGTETILVIDDNEKERKAMLHWLRRHGYKVLVASNGKTAFEIFQSASGSLETPIDLVIIDMIMADEWDGLDTYRNILTINPNQKAILLSGFAIIGRTKEALQLGAGQHLLKPYTLKELGLAIRQELDKPERSPANPAPMT